MKRNYKLLIVIFTVFLLLLGCSNEKPNSINEQNKKEEEIEVIEEVTAPFVDNNPITIGLYSQKDFNSNRELLTNYSSNWSFNVDLGAFEVFGTNESQISGKVFQNVWNDYWNKYDNIEDYKIGYHIKFKTTSGDTIEETILRPIDAAPIYEYLQVYLYDEVHQTIGSWYSHIEDKDFNENTILTTIKLTGSTKIAEIVSPIELMAFSYDGEGDFDFDNNMYLGVSRYTLNINKSN